MPVITLPSGLKWDPGIDPYRAQDAAMNNRASIEKSEICGCISCSAIFKPAQIAQWWGEGKTACCPFCGLTDVVIGSASGLPITEEYLSMAGGHVVR